MNTIMIELRCHILNVLVERNHQNMRDTDTEFIEGLTISNLFSHIPHTDQIREQYTNLISRDKRLVLIGVKELYHQQRVTGFLRTIRRHRRRISRNNN